MKKSTYSSPTLEIPNRVSECALDVPGTICSTKEAIHEMKKHLISTSASNDAERNNIMVVSAKNIVDTIKKSLNCSTEKCVLLNMSKTIDENKKHVLKNSLDRIKPNGPANSTKLLNNENIDNVLKKLSKLHNGFYHMNFQMIDFAGEKIGNDWKIIKGIKITPTALGKLDMTTDVINKGFKTFGVVMNTDVRTNGGIHWFALFCDFRTHPFTIEYFNSSGNKPVKQIQDWLIKTELNITKHDNKAKVIILSGVAHQKSQTECGLYSLYFIWNRLNGIPALNFQEKKIADSKMTEFRKHCFAES